MEEMVKEHAAAVRRAKLRKSWLQPDADSWWVPNCKRGANWSCPVV
jgi:hypothetical protein